MIACGNHWKLQSNMKAAIMPDGSKAVAKTLELIKTLILKLMLWFFKCVLKPEKYLKLSCLNWMCNYFQCPGSVYSTKCSSRTCLNIYYWLSLAPELNYYFLNHPVCSCVWRTWMYVCLVYNLALSCNSLSFWVISSPCLSLVLNLCTMWFIDMLRTQPVSFSA